MPELPRSEEHTSELQSHSNISYAVFCLKKKIDDETMIAHLHRLLSSSLRPTLLLQGALLSPMEATIYHHPVFFFFTDTATAEIYTLLYTLSLHDALPILISRDGVCRASSSITSMAAPSARLRSEEHTSELQSHSNISYAVFCLKKKN